MKKKVSELVGPALDWAVMKALGHLRSDKVHRYASGLHAEGLLPTSYVPVPESVFDIALHMMPYSTSGGLSMPIIHSANISLAAPSLMRDQWRAMCDSETRSDWITCDGPTPMIAAMRVYVTYKLGDEIDVPGELS